MLSVKRPFCILAELLAKVISLFSNLSILDVRLKYYTLLDPHSNNVVIYLIIKTQKLCYLSNSTSGKNTNRVTIVADHLTTDYFVVQLDPGYVYSLQMQDFLLQDVECTKMSFDPRCLKFLGND